MLETYYNILTITSISALLSIPRGLRILEDLYLNNFNHRAIFTV